MEFDYFIPMRIEVAFLAPPQLPASLLSVSGPGKLREDLPLALWHLPEGNLHLVGAGADGSGEAVLVCWSLTGRKSPQRC